VSGLISRLDERFLDAVGLILACRGRVVVKRRRQVRPYRTQDRIHHGEYRDTGFLRHAAEAGHGDLGMITRDDVVAGAFNSGQSDELHTIIP